MTGKAVEGHLPAVPRLEPVFRMASTRPLIRRSCEQKPDEWDTTVTTGSAN